MFQPMLQFFIATSIHLECVMELDSLLKKIMLKFIETTILNSKSKGADVFIPHLPVILTDMPFEFKRLQFPVILAFSMTINKAQCQSLQVYGLNLENPCFAHRQLYVSIKLVRELLLTVKLY